MTATNADAARGVALVTDSSACLPSTEIARHHIEIVPIVLIWNGVEMRDGVDITPEEFWRRLSTERELPTTSTVSPGEFAAAFERVRERAGSAVCVCIPRRLSTMYEAAALAARELHGRLPVEVVEAGGAAMASGFATLLAARAAAAGADHAGVAATARRAARHGQILAVLDSLEYVARSGRLPAIVARIADAMPSTFVLRLHRGRVGVKAKFGSRKRAVDSLVNDVRKAARGAAYLGVAVHYGANRAEAEELVERVRRELRPDDCYLTSFTPVMGAHVGPGLVGISYCALSA